MHQSLDFARVARCTLNRPWKKIRPTRSRLAAAISGNAYHSLAIPAAFAKSLGGFALNFDRRVLSAVDCQIGVRGDEQRLFVDYNSRTHIARSKPRADGTPPRIVRIGRQTKQQESRPMKTIQYGQQGEHPKNSQHDWPNRVASGDTPAFVRMQPWVRSRGVAAIKQHQVP